MHLRISIPFVSGFIWLLRVSAASEDGNEDTSYWINMVKSELDEALKVRWNTARARNVVLFIGDGMGPNTVTATRIHKHGEGGRLSFEKFPNVGLLKTYCNDMMIPDSACTATALLRGVKVNYETAGVDASVKLNDCNASLNEDARLTSLVNMARDAGMSTGFVTTMRVTHATPCALYSYTASRKWECEAKMPAGAERCKDIARQLVEDEPGRSMNVVMGGGRQCLVSNVTGTDADPIDTWGCYRSDGRDLIETWKKDKEDRKLKHSVLQSEADLKEMDVENTDYLLGIFANGHLRLEFERNGTGMPSLTQMTEAALKVLQKNKKGYFLMVEGGNIDMAHHRGKAKKAIGEAAEMDEAVKKVLEMTDSRDTLVIVTSDHTHTLAINGYTKRGGDIFGLSRPSKIDGKNYTVLSYTTGGEESYQFSVIENDKNESVVDRRDPSRDDTNDYEYSAQAAILVDENTHGGGDVIVYALGPFGHLFHNVHEQHYVPLAISYAAGLGDYSEFRPNTASSISSLNSVLFMVVFFMCCK